MQRNRTLVQVLGGTSVVVVLRLLYNNTRVEPPYVAEPASMQLMQCQAGPLHEATLALA